MAFRMKTLFLTAPLLFPSFSSIAESTDTRLVGNWQGQRSQEGKCSFMAWKMGRTADGKFEVTFYSDPEKTRILGKEKGHWEVKDGRLSLLTDGIPTPDLYVYTFIGRVEMWRGGRRFRLSVSTPFVRWCPSSVALAPFPHPAHRTGRADFPHPALFQHIKPSRSHGRYSSAAGGSIPRFHRGTGRSIGGTPFPACRVCASTRSSDDAPRSDRSGGRFGLPAPG